MQKSFGEQTITINSTSVGKARVLNAYPFPAIFPALGITLGVTLIAPSYRTSTKPHCRMICNCAISKASYDSNNIAKPPASFTGPDSEGMFGLTDMRVRLLSR